MDIGSKKSKLVRAIGLLLLAGTAALLLHGALPRSEAAAAESAAPENTAPPREGTAAPLMAETRESTPAQRRKSVYTLILAGMDEVSGNTDTIVIGRVDAEARRIDLVSIPRDTYVNRSWDVRKINCAYTMAKNAGNDGLEGLREAARGLCGFDADCCAVMDLETVKQAIDLMGGVYFDVPFDMDYEDAAQDLSIHIPAGYQCLNGEQCVQLCRYRKNYVNGDIDRISLQHDFLAAGRLLRRQRSHGGEHRLSPALRDPVQRGRHRLLHDAEPARRRGRTELYLCGKGRVARDAQRHARSFRRADRRGKSGPRLYRRWPVPLHLGHDPRRELPV